MHTRIASLAGGPKFEQDYLRTLDPPLIAN